MQLQWWKIQATSDLRGCTQPPCSMRWNSDTQKPAEVGRGMVDGTHHSNRVWGVI